MSEEKPSKAETIAKSVERVSDSKGLAAIGFGLGIGLAAFAFALMMASIVLSGSFERAAKNWDGKLHPDTQILNALSFRKYLG